MPQLSASTLKLFQECPRCFWFHINKKIERPRGPFPSLPSGIDRVLKRYFDAYRRQGALPPLIDGKLEGALVTSPLTLGFNDAKTGARLWGKLDDGVILPDRRVAPLDHKTRASAPEDVSYTEKYYQFQIPTDPESAYEIFAAACRCLDGPLPPSGDACEFCRWADARPPSPSTVPEDLFA